MNPNIVKAGEATRFTSETAPKGRVNLGLSVNEWRNALAEYSRADLQAIVSDPDAKVSKIMAAQELLKAIDGNLIAIAQACDYSNHKPLNKSDVTHHNDEPRTESERATARDSALARIRGRIQRTA